MEGKVYYPHWWQQKPGHCLRPCLACPKVALLSSLLLRPQKLSGPLSTKLPLNITLKELCNTIKVLADSQLVSSNQVSFERGRTKMFFVFFYAFSWFWPKNSFDLQIGLLFYFTHCSLAGCESSENFVKVFPFQHSPNPGSILCGWVGEMRGEGYWSGQSFIGQDGDADSRRLLMEGWMEFSPHRVVVVAACWHNQGRIWQILL